VPTVQSVRPSTIERRGHGGIRCIRAHATNAFCPPKRWRSSRRCVGAAQTKRPPALSRGPRLAELSRKRLSRPP
jgi:hypothetical protein